MPKSLSTWKPATVATETKLAAALTNAVSNESLQTAVAISQGFGDIHLQNEGAGIMEYSMSLIML